MFYNRIGWRLAELSNLQKRATNARLDHVIEDDDNNEGDQEAAK